MIDGPAVAALLGRLGFTHAVWVPDSALGRWEPALSVAGGPRLVRATREGEAIGLAAGLLLGGARPLVLMQCTGLFEAGDALRNVVHDLGLPLHLLVGVRSWHAAREGRSADNCPHFTEPLVRAWRLPFRWLDGPDPLADLEAALSAWQATGTAGVALLPE